VIRQLLASGLLAPQGEYNTLGVTPVSAGVLRGETPVPLRQDALGRKSRPSVRKTSTADTLAEEDRGLFERLREWRAGQAREQGVPAYIVFGDATLRALAEHRPSTLGELSSVSGVGQKKLDAYGEQVLDLVREG
ncbi:MAG: HRDC domain-containing protein, partial [Microbacterium gubbeenense]